jgi:spore maturation protein CgeB
MTHKKQIMTYEQRALTFWLLIACATISLLVYIYAINTTARNISLGQNIERRLNQTLTNIDTLEFAYIELKNNVTIELAYEQGFQETHLPLYISRHHTPSLSFNTLNR